MIQFFGSFVRGNTKGLAALLIILSAQSLSAASNSSGSGKPPDDECEPGFEVVRSADEATVRPPVEGAAPRQRSPRTRRRAGTPASATSTATNADAAGSANVVANSQVTEGQTRATETSARSSTVTRWSLQNFFSQDDATNLAIQHPFTVANAAEKMHALLTYRKPVASADPLYGIRPTVVYPILTGDPLAGGRRIVGNEEALDALVQFTGSMARGDRSGKAFGFPGPAGTGKTELLYVIDNVQKNLSRQDPRFREFSYRFRNLETIPFLRNMFRIDRESGRPSYAYIDPDIPRSPFTLLREDMQRQVLERALPSIRRLHGLTVTRGWTKPEPKTRAIIRAILEHKYPEIAEGQMTPDDLTPEQYMAAINEYIVVVPKETIQRRVEPQIIRAQTDDPNYEALFARPNLLRQAFYSGGEAKDLGVDYNGQVFQQDGGFLMMDELYRNPAAFLNLLLEVKQNRMVQTDYGDPVEIDIVPLWNSNFESIAKAREDMALKASIDRDQPRAMRLLLVPNQIEATSLFQVEINRFKQRALSETALSPLDFNQVYPAPDKAGRTESAYGRYALYYESDDSRILIAPMALNYMSWLAAASRFETDVTKMMRFQSELNLVARDPSLFNNAITRLKIILGDREVTPAERMELYKVSHLLQEGNNGISARDVETWVKNAISLAIKSGKGVMTPRMIDQAFEDALVNGEIQVQAGDVRANWQNLRTLIKTEILLPRLERDVRAIISGDGDKANRVYDEIEREFIETAQDASATHITPDDGSQPILINRVRLQKIRDLYRRKYGREFSANFLLRNLTGARRNGGTKRDPQLLETIREFLAEEDALTADYISAFDSFYRHQNPDPTIAEKVGHVEARLAQFGYDKESFKEAVAYTAQLRQQKLARAQQQGGQ